MGRQKRPPPVFSHREMVQLVGMVVALLTVLALLARLRQPGSMEWFFAAEPAAMTPPAETRQNAAKHVALAQPKPGPNVDPATPLRDIRDRTSRDAADRAAIMHYLALAAQQPAGELTNSSRRDVLFANLFNEPEKYRGKPVRIHGLLRRAVHWPLDAAKEVVGLDGYYELWIFPEDQRVNPCLILCAELPAGIAPSATLAVQVEIEAYFIKLFVYQADDGARRLAPMLVGRAPRLLTPAISTRTLDPLQWTLIAVAALTLLGLALAWRRLAMESAVKSWGARPVIAAGPDQNPFAPIVEPPTERVESTGEHG